MSEFDRKKYSVSSKGKLYTDPNSKRNLAGKGNKDSLKELSSEVKIKQPTILLKTREPNPEDVSISPKRKQKETESAQITIAGPPKETEAVSVTKSMKNSFKLVDDSSIRIEHLQDYMQENADFLVIGVVGAQGVGKSTILNFLAHNKTTENLIKSIMKNSKGNLSDNENLTINEQMDKVHLGNNEIFRTEAIDDIENCLNATQGVDIYITSNRVILLDCQPLLSVSVLDDLIECESKRTNLISEFIPLENSGEIQSLQYTAFLMSVCHILLFVQDWFFDSNIVRFIQTAEMLKPTMSNPEDEYSEYFPHLVLIHNRAQMVGFTPSEFKIMQAVYKNVFHKTKLQLQSNIGMGSGRLINSLNPENCGSPINLFLIPEYDETPAIYRGHPPMEDLIKRLRGNLFGAAKNPLTHVQLTEKTWLIYCSKVWETVKKNPFFVEYSKLMP